MSQENMEIVRRVYDRWNGGDMEAMLECFHADLEFGTSGVFPGLDPVYRGHEGYRKFWGDFSATWESIRISMHEMRDCGERVLALVTFDARGRDGLEVHRPAGSIFSFRDGLIVAVENHEDWAGAIDAVERRD